MQILIWNGLQVLHSFSPRVKAGRKFRSRIQAINTASNVAFAAHMKTEAIIEHWFGKEAEVSDQSSGQCSHGDDIAEEEGDGDNENDMY
ncbi:uncharacterized protein DS421_16g561910 [Arachis hypogaea]|nr:uncharacterized protein DS421_16g561910 [Arachis hypogaea]